MNGLLQPNPRLTPGSGEPDAAPPEWRGRGAGIGRSRATFRA